ncbi:sodium-independent anion transporter [Marinobacterium zhoushanense]|uniref:Sodium-independent anion transporter n=1 Tax=Marinobacterium zhoushanense TaxID=1679163 RepID=A0ABQ1K0E8_9GAMM|nr:sulfate permease [Marinobacterium zhoushanense]GGB79839.1 sodium-independent anion transporter [Marinobacterium zhoushanense]
MKSERWGRYLPFLSWARRYDRNSASSDGLAAIILTLLLIPQSLAYAMLAGLPPVVGLYASIMPPIAYALLGTSRTLAVGPVAVVALLTASALTPLFTPGTTEYVQAALLLALLSGGVMLMMSLLRLGFLISFLSHPVISGFISASAILITLSQLRHILGVQTTGDTALELLRSTLFALTETHLATLAIGALSLVFLYLCRNRGNVWLTALGFTPSLASTLNKAAPLLTLLVTALLVKLLDLDQRGVAVVGEVPRELPALTLPPLDPELIVELLPLAVLISLVGFIGSVSVAQTFAARRRERVAPNQELIALGGANILTALSSGMPVSGGFSRSVVSYEAGAQTPMAGALSALGMALTVLLFAPLFESLPRAVLAAIIIVAVLSLVDLAALKRTWQYAWQDGAAMLATMLGVLLINIETGLLMGLGLSLLLFLWRTSQPHIAVIGQLPGSQHFRNVARFHVVESHSVLSVRVDENLYFPNARYLEDRISELVAARPGISHLVLMCSGVNLIDASALESLEAIGERLHAAGIQLHLSEVKGPVMDRLRRARFLDLFGGRVFISHYEALLMLDPQTTRNTLNALASHCPIQSNLKPVKEKPE